MRFQYIGNGKEDPLVTVFFGYRFELNGEAVEVEGDALKKIANNPTFKAKLGRPPKA